MHQVPKRIAVVIPCHDEADSIRKVIDGFEQKKLAKERFRVSLYVVDNASTDNTAQIAHEAGAQVIAEPRAGKGFALRAGFHAIAKNIDYVVMLDGDDTYSPQEILRMVEPLQSDFCDVVVGSRLGGRIQNEAMTPFNRLGNWLFTNAVRVFYRANVSDVLSGYFAWKKPALDNLYPHLKSPGFAIEMEMITKMARMRYRLASVPISYHPRAGDSHLRPVRDGSRILRMLFKNLAWRPVTRQVSTQLAEARKIVFVSDTVYPYVKGGKEKRLYEISKRLAVMGYDVHIYTMHWWKGNESTCILHGVTLHAICKEYPLYDGDRRSIKEALCFALACFKLFAVRFDVLDVDHMPFFPILSTWVVCSLRFRKFYGTWHEALSREEWTNYMGRNGSIASFVERVSVRLPNTIIAASAHTRQTLADLHGRAERVALVASGIDLRHLASIEPADVRCDVLFVGRLVKDKNVRELIKAVQLSAKNKPEVRCIIIGEGPEKGRLERMVSKLNLRQQVSFIGQLEDADEIYAYMKAAKVLCLPSVREGFSIVTLEALGCGTPVITADAPANAAMQLIEEGKNGSIVACRADELAKAITHWTSFTQKPDTCQQIAAYDWDTLARQQAEVYGQ